MSGLDPFGRRDVRELILEQRERGVTVLFSSHILPDVEMLCDRVAIVLQGRCGAPRPSDELMTQSRHRVEIRCVRAPVLEMPTALERAADPRTSDPEGTVVHARRRRRVVNAVRAVAHRARALSCARGHAAARDARGVLPVRRDDRRRAHPGARHRRSRMNAPG